MRTLLAVMSAVGLFALQNAVAGDPAPRSVTVNGTAVVRVVPDEVTVWLRVESLDKDLRKSKADNDTRVQKVLALTRELKIESQHVQTADAGIQEEWDHEQRDFKGYKSVTRISVKLTELKGYDDFVARAVEAGGALLDSIEFGSSHAIEKRVEARRLALKAAREKAVAMAGELDQKVGKPLTIVEQGTGSGWDGSRWYSSNSNVYQPQAGESGAIPDASTLAPGQIEIQARVMVSFELQ